MFGPCMCGDICCPSCGPAQGNSRCLVCGEWASEGCAEPGKCEADMPAAMERERLAVEAEAKQYAEEAAYENAYAAWVEEQQDKDREYDE